MKNAKILITGPTGQVAYPVALKLAETNEVSAAARFSDPKKRDALQAAGIRCINVDMAQGDFRELPQDFDYVLNFAVVRDVGNDFDTELTSNAEAVGLLMQHCPHRPSIPARILLRRLPPGRPRSAHGKKSARRQSPNDVRDLQRRQECPGGSRPILCTRIPQIPTIICRLNVPYGNNGGWPYYHMLMMEHGVPMPVNTDAPSTYTLIHEDDIISSIPPLLAAARIPPLTSSTGAVRTMSASNNGAATLAS